ncbi:hypothetical protein K7432_014948 [Basidiobolus ranarum]|uniref:Histidine-specific methyltransferase SAM-dependent domain-containing protein n=1 Tax=Basidiobolus ranarum TaxID=34480 RepID=A0ABR2VPL5_9FUNG
MPIANKSVNLDALKREDMRSGLAKTPKRFPGRYIYDSRGSELFDALVNMPGYYILHVEHEILRRHAVDIAASIPARILVDLGSASSEKTYHLIGVLHEKGSLSHYTAVDLSHSALKKGASTLCRDYPDLVIQSVVGDFNTSLNLNPQNGPTLVTILGGTFGNHTPTQRHLLLSSIRSQLNPGDALLLGTNLLRNEQTMVSAYNDDEGTMASFLKNSLTVLNYELGANFDPDSFDHVTVWNSQEERVESCLRARRSFNVTLSQPEQTVMFEDKELLHCGFSYRFREEGLRSELAAAGFKLACWWTDLEGHCAITLSHPVPL